MSFIFAAVFNVYPATYEPISENPSLTFSVISDIHMESNNPDRLKRFPKILMDISGAKRKNDALILLGDNTMNGQFIEHCVLTAQLKLFANAKNILPVMGNHEIFTPENGYEKGSRKFRMFAGYLAGEKLDKTYYSKEINGCRFIVLGSEADMGVQAYLSDEQLSWLDSLLAEADKNGNPSFVFCHFPIEGTVVSFWQEGMIGKQGERLYEILTSHKNVFYFSGHLHNEVTVSGVTQKDGVTFIDLPCLLGEGVGCEAEYHDGTVELRMRNHETGEWLEALSRSISLN